MKINGIRSGLSALAILAATSAPAAWAEELSYVSGAVGNAIENFKKTVKPWEDATGHTVTIVPMPASTSDQFAQYRLWLAAGTADIDLYQTDVIWAPQLADHFVDLTEAAKDLIPQHFESVIASQTVDGKLVALPLFTDAPALYYRSDLLEKHGKAVPETWADLTRVAQEIQEAERAEGNADLWGYVWQGNAYEGLTCNALEWVKSAGGGQIVEPDGTISINNENAVRALEVAKEWVGTISPPGVMSYMEEEARGVWQTGNAVFMRNWPYAFSLSNGDDSAVKGKFDVAPLPSGGEGSAATLGGWNVAVSKYSTKQEAAISLALYLAGIEGQKATALNNSNLPTITALFDDPEIAQQVPLIPRWKPVFEQAVPRPSAPTKGKYNEVSARFWSAVHQTLSGDGSAAENLELLELDLDDLKGSGW
ncbi:ABC transporter substrate-binding protein [Paracoccus spongiarum]|uniref:ABC transporter substrate-binding protein n=1 Tax=Paracoccus spongiarum TaxID=3064387 RepID=A0ABT9JC53_9RHOB|nr:ABC transporter substrate-binding protein [Paracoccus sp. 2205BS29-5]MDP5307390.1 ABC transporter substrate-binding protein [Paracoccus sp. 2205BS29-5]